MSFPATTEPLPLMLGPDGVIRISSTRVTLDTVVAAFREGLTPEGIVDEYPSLRVPDVYFFIGYFLSHADEVEAYLASRQRQVDAVRRENEARFDPNGIRDRLLARRAAG
jgi:uncharacterized protein (DUF433 family)